MPRAQPARPLQPAMPPIHRKHSTIAERARVFTLHAKGTKLAEIEELTGIKRIPLKPCYAQQRVEITT